MTVKAYIYPRTKRGKNTTNNPYLKNFIESVREHIVFLNENQPTAKGIFNLIPYIGKIDYLFLNWIEDLPDKKWGFLQTVFFYFVLLNKRLLGIKVVWTIHNKISHFPGNLRLKKFLFRQLLRRSDLIITHADEGVRFAEMLYPGVSKKIFYFPHPIVPLDLPRIHPPKKYDVLIWGSLSPYKGIHDFLAFLHRKGASSQFRMMIVGKTVSESFYNQLKQYTNSNIILRNEFVSKEELASLIFESKIVLFTYSGDSVLSSGALIDSIAHYANIAGPNVGAFQEMGKLGIISTYSDFPELIEVLQNLNEHSEKKKLEKVREFIHNHTWEKFGQALQQRITKTGKP